MKIAILGAGISGISLFDILKRNYGITCDIFEKETRIGGLCRTEVVNQQYVYDLGGGHIFNSKYPEVIKYVFDLLAEGQWEYSKRKAKIAFGETIVDYPFEFSLSKLTVDVAADCIQALFERDQKAEVRNFADFLLKHFGKGLYENYLEPYNTKIWKYDLQQIDYDWVEGKMPYPDARDILLKTLSRNTDETHMVHSTFYYPASGGIQTLIKVMGQDIPKLHIGESIEKIEFVNEKTIVNGNAYDLVINTIPLPELGRCIAKLPSDVVSAIDNLKYNSVCSYLFEMDQENDWSWLYIPNQEIIPHRIVYQGNLAKRNAPEGKSSITMEITQSEKFSESQILSNIETYLHLKNPLAQNYSKYAYVVFDLQRQENMRRIKEFCAAKHLILHGRFAEWTYPNMDICIKNSFDLAEQIGAKAR